MAKIHGRRSQVYLNGVDMSNYCNNTESQNQIDLAECSGFGDTIKGYVPGLKAGSKRLQGWFDNTPGATGIDTVLNSVEQVESPAPILTLINSPDINAAMQSGTADLQSGRGLTSPIGGAVGFSAEFMASGGFNRGFSTIAKATLGVSNSPTGATANDGGGSNGCVAYLHAFGSVSGTPVVAIEHSVDGATAWAVLATFASFTSGSVPQAQRVTANGTVRSFKRLTITGGTANIWVGVSNNQSV